MRSVSLVPGVVAAASSLVVFYTVPGISVSSPYQALMLAVLLGLANGIIPFVAAALGNARTVLGTVLFALGVNCFLLYIIHRYPFGLQADSLFSLMVAGSIIGVIGFMSTLSIRS